MGGRERYSGGANSIVNTGGTDSLTTPSGYNVSTKQMRYHYIEDFVGNLMEWLDGIRRNGTTYKGTDDPSKYSDISAMNTLSYSAPSEGSKTISALGWDDQNPFLVMPKEVEGTDYTKYFCDTFSFVGYGSNSKCGSEFNANSAQYGLFMIYIGDYSFYDGGRLLYKPAA